MNRMVVVLGVRPNIDQFGAGTMVFLLDRGLTMVVVVSSGAKDAMQADLGVSPGTGEIALPW